MQSVNIRIIDKFVRYQSVDQRFWCAGQVLRDGIELCPKTLLAELSQLPVTGIVEFLEQLDGFFSLVWRTDTSVFLISDRLRSYPLFYADTPTGFWLSDDIELLVEQLELKVSEPLACAEFLQLGYVTGTASTVAGISQVPAASWVNWDGALISTGRYFEFLPQRMKQATLPELKQQLSEVMSRLTHQLIEKAAGRQIVVPLSGGLDSRALLLSLFQQGYPHLCCFTFGAAGSWELQNARKLCAALGVDWHPVYYDANTFRDLRADAEFERYLLFIHSGVSAPNVQVYPAIRELTRKGIIRQDALVIPGHTGDFVSGGHRRQLNSDASTQIKVAAGYIWQIHYQLQRHCADQLALTGKLTDQLTLIAAQQPGIDAADLAEAWNFRERQAKLIVNSNRYYEFFQLAWWMPFWQRDFVHYWLSVPQQYRLNQLLWREWVNELLTQLRPDYQAPAYRAPKHIFWRRAAAVLDYFTDRNRLLTIVPFHRWLLYRLRLTKRSGNLFGYLADKTLSLAEQHRYHKASRRDNGKELHDR